MSEIYLKLDDLKRLNQLYHNAASTPVICFPPGPDWAASAWEECRRFMDELGRKYGYDPRVATINPATGEVRVKDE